MPKRRSEMSIYVDILRFIFSSQDLARPTHIMYKANLSHKAMMKYLNKMMEEKLIEKKDIGGKAYFALAEKGRQFLIGYQKVRVFTDAFGIDV
jgi:predicted transcriptional regulator